MWGLNIEVTPRHWIFWIVTLAILVAFTLTHIITEHLHLEDLQSITLEGHKCLTPIPIYSSAL